MHCKLEARREYSLHRFSLKREGYGPVLAVTVRFVEESFMMAVCFTAALLFVGFTAARPPGPQVPS